MRRQVMERVPVCALTAIRDCGARALRAIHPFLKKSSQLADASVGERHNCYCVPSSLVGPGVGLCLDTFRESHGARRLRRSPGVLAVVVLTGSSM